MRLEFLNPESVIAGLRVNGKKQALQELSAQAARQLRIDKRVVFEITRLA